MEIFIDIIKYYSSFYLPDEQKPEKEKESENEKEEEERKEEGNNETEQVKNENEKIVSLLFSLISHLFVDSKETAVKFSELGGLSLLISYLQVPNENIQLHASSGLLLFSSYRGKLQVIFKETESSFENLLFLLQSTHEKIISQTCKSIQNLIIDNDENRKIFCNFNGPSMIVHSISRYASHHPLRLLLLHTLLSLSHHSGLLLLVSFCLFFFSRPFIWPIPTLQIS